MTEEIVIALLAATVQSGTPILFATLGEIFTEKSGVLNLGVEGVMILGALAGFIVARQTGNPVLGFFVAGLVGSLATAIHGVVCLWFQGNQVVSGLALTILGTGLANYLGTSFIGTAAPGFAPFAVPGLSAIPVHRPDLFSTRSPGLCQLSHPPGHVAVFLPGPGLASACGRPASIRRQRRRPGLNVGAYRWLGVLGGGFFMGLGGAYLSLAYTHLWTTNITAGRGWIAVALVIFAFWRPGRAVFGAYLFGGIMALQLRLQASGTQLPSSILLMLPYALTVIVLVLSSWRKRTSDEPASLGVNIAPVD